MADTLPSLATASSYRSVEERRAAGRELRKSVPRRSLGDWSPGPGRDAVAILTDQERSRVPELVPVRRERMAASPFSFFRGAAAVMAADLADAPRTGLKVQLCGDAHLVNFGGFASPERSLVFDLNDFDETIPGPFEWDLKRLAASFEVAGRSNGFDAAARVRLQTTLARTYAEAMADFAELDNLDLWYRLLDADQVLRDHAGQFEPDVVARVSRTMEKARGKDRLKALRKLTTMERGELRFASDPPLLCPIRELMEPDQEEELFRLVHEAFVGYRRSLQPDRRQLLERYRFVDLARKVVGVGSVGTRCWVALLLGRDDRDPLFLQVKEAQRSVLEPYLERSVYDHQGRRVVEGQRLVQATSDIFLGWERVVGPDGVPRDHYFRQLWDWKVSADVDAMDPPMMDAYAQLCGRVLARAHARTGDGIAISAYLGSGKVLAETMGAFAAAYADQNERDHAEAVARWADQDGS